MNPPRQPKLSGSELAAQLGDLSFPTGRPLAAVPPAPPATTEASPPKARGGRPAKAGTDGIPVNVRLAQPDHMALAKIAAELMVPGRPLPTVQDIVRGLIRGAIKDPDLLKRLVHDGER